MIKENGHIRVAGKVTIKGTNYIAYIKKLDDVNKVVEVDIIGRTSEFKNVPFEWFTKPSDTNVQYTYDELLPLV